MYSRPSTWCARGDRAGIEPAQYPKHGDGRNFQTCQPGSSWPICRLPGQDHLQRLSAAKTFAKQQLVICELIVGQHRRIREAQMPSPPTRDRNARTNVRRRPIVAGHQTYQPIPAREQITPNPLDAGRHIGAQPGNSGSHVDLGPLDQSQEFDHVRLGWQAAHGSSAFDGKLCSDRIGHGLQFAKRFRRKMPGRMVVAEGFGGQAAGTQVMREAALRRESKLAPLAASTTTPIRPPAAMFPNVVPWKSGDSIMVAV